MNSLNITIPIKRFLQHVGTLHPIAGILKMVGKQKMNKTKYSVALAIILFLILYNPLQSSQQETGIWNQPSSSSKIVKAKSQLLDAWYKYVKASISYKDFKKVAKKSIRVLGFTQFNHAKTSSIIDPLFYAALNADYSFMLSLLKKFANPHFSQINLISVIEQMDTTESNPDRDTIIALLNKIG